MLGSHTDELALLVKAATAWRLSAAPFQVDLIQINCTFPDGRPLALVWNPEAIANPDGTFTGDWEVYPS